MSRKPDVALDPVTCIRCGAPLEASSGESLVCAECRESTPTQRTLSESSDTVCIERAGVSLTKTLEFGTDPPRVEYLLQSVRTQPVRVRITDHLPERPGKPPNARSDPTSGPGRPVDVTWWISSNDTVEFHRDPPGVEESARTETNPSVERVPHLRILGDDGSGPRAGIIDGVGVPVRERGLDASSGSNGATVLAAIPAHNETGSIGDVVGDARAYADAVLVVDDGSDDDTGVRAAEAGAFVVEHDSNRGYGAALKTIFREASRVNVDHLVILDGDGQHDPSDVPRLVDEQQSRSASIVVANRFGEQSATAVPTYRWLGLTVVNTATNLSMRALGSAIRTTDTQSGFRAYDRTAIGSLADDDRIGDGMGASTDILSHAGRRNYDVAEVETTMNYRVPNANNDNQVAHGLHLLWNIGKTVTRERPLRFLGLPGVVTLVAGAALLSFVLGHSPPTNVVPVLGAVTSLLLALCGVVLCIAAVAVAR